jgi:hypothetical protein
MNRGRAVSEFARLQAHGNSALYEELTDRIADDEKFVRRIGTLPPGNKQQTLRAATSPGLRPGGAPTSAPFLRSQAPDPAPSPTEIARTGPSAG